MKSVSLIAATVASFLALPAFAQIPSPAEYVATAGASDLYERTSSQVVLETTQNPRVRNFARMMIDAHAKSTAEVKAAAMKSKVKAAPPKLMPVQAEMVAKLRAEKGAARDAAYIAQQKAAHNKALTMQQAYARQGTAPALRAVAGRIVSVVENHIMMLKAM